MTKKLKVVKTDSEWREQLTDIQYQITRNHGTERAFSSPNFDTSIPGTFLCVCCERPLYRSEDKYESHSGWPSFTKPIDNEAVSEFPDTSHGMIRTEIRCSDCDAHLGHVFPDGPPPLGLRYCMNGHAMIYKTDDK